MANETPLSCKNSIARVGSSVWVGVYEAEEDDECDWIDASSGEDGDFDTDIPGQRRCMGRVAFWWARQANQFDAPLLIKSGVTLVDVKIYLSGIASPFWSYPSFAVRRVIYRSVLRTRHEVTVEFKARGVFSLPTGNFP